MALTFATLVLTAVFHSTLCQIPPGNNFDMGVQQGYGGGQQQGYGGGVQPQGYGGAGAQQPYDPQVNTAYGHQSSNLPGQPVPYGAGQVQPGGYGAGGNELSGGM